ncbi:putative bromodomain protein [Plasmodium gaboni]|uniref:Putative bromodomain protein n=1 Tax=Plasmodium gaboni TaxID=647221 RepID=A0A151LBL3_9APIC|nr:putative bromodomain protein [Plasmodium gaboni]KYN96338.1 putative bromodomain protein [Plasmodium gaboni]
MNISKIKYDEIEEVKSKNEVLTNLLNKLIAFDKKRIFLYPVNVELVPDYLNVIKEPMDFTTMKQKLQNFKYKSFQEFENDILLIINNCYTYNDPSTIYYKFAEDMETYYKKLNIKMQTKYMNIHLFYHKDDKEALNIIQHNATLSTTMKRNSLKENKKIEKPRKSGRVGRPSKIDKHFHKHKLDNNQKEYNKKGVLKKNRDNKRKQASNQKHNKNLMNDKEFNNNNMVISNFMFAHQYIGTLEHILDEEHFHSFLKKLLNCNEKSEDVFYLLINALLDQKSKMPLLSNYTNISKSLYQIFIEDSICSDYNLKNESLLDNNNHEKYNDPISLNTKKKKEYSFDTLKNDSTHNKSPKIMFEYEQNGDINNKSSPNKSTIQNLHINNSNNNNNIEQLQHNNNTQHPKEGLDIKEKREDPNLEDTHNHLIENGIDDEFKNIIDKKNKESKEIITCNIDDDEMTMNLLNYKKSVENFIGDYNLDTFINIFPNIHNILDNTESKILHYSPFNDLRMFGLDIQDFDDFNKNIVYNNDFLLGIGRFHIKNILSLDKDLSKILFNEQNDSQFSNKLKTYLLNNKHKKEQKKLINKNDTNMIIEENIQTNHNNNDAKIDSVSNIYDSLNINQENTYNNNNNDNNNIQVNGDSIDNVISDSKNIINNNISNMEQFSACLSDSTFSDSSSDEENINMQNFLNTYNSFDKEFLYNNKINVLSNYINNDDFKFIK